jgi:citrate synthase
MGFPTDMFPVLFTIPRVSGWLAHWNESLNDPAGVRIFRPRQKYVGKKENKWVPMEERDIENNDSKQLGSYWSQHNIRRLVSDNYWHEVQQQDGEFKDLVDDMLSPM